MNNDLKDRIVLWLQYYTVDHGRTSHRKSVELFRELLALPEESHREYVGGDIDPHRKNIPWGSSEDDQ